MTRQDDEDGCYSIIIVSEKTGKMIAKFIVVLVALLCIFSVDAKKQRKNELVQIGDDKIGEVVVSPRPRRTKAELPKNFDYRSLGLLTADLNQHIPVYW
jgi:uncharacterized membrane protein YecN with MAPEG domain